MKLIVQDHLSLHEMNEQFTKLYPFLKLQFYANNVNPELNKEEPGELIKKYSMSLHDLIHAKVNSVINMSPDVTVKSFEQKWFDEAGVWCQVFRKSGNVWLQTTVTDDMTLSGVNEFGQQMSEPIDKPTPDDYHEQL